LAGASSQAIFHLKQAMGGGKTHSFVGFGLLARHSGLRKTYCAGMPHSSTFKGISQTIPSDEFHGQGMGKKEKGISSNFRNPFLVLVPLPRFERGACGLGIRRSIRLSYRGDPGERGFRLTRFAAGVNKSLFGFSVVNAI
jgi:hypothetical protein